MYINQLKHYYKKLLNLSGFAAKLEHWRSRTIPDNCMSHMYDGKAWKDSLSEKHESFLATKRSIGTYISVTLNVDFSAIPTHSRVL